MREATLVALAFELVDEAGEIVEATALGAPVDDAQHGVAGGELRADADAGRRLDVALDRGAQGDEAGIDDRLRAGGLQQGAHGHPADHGQDQQADGRLRGAAVPGPEPGSLLGECIEGRFARRAAWRRWPRIPVAGAPGGRAVLRRSPAAGSGTTSGDLEGKPFLTDWLIVTT